MSIQSEIDRISANVQSSLDVIRNAGVEVPTPSSSNDLPTLTEKMAGEKQDKLTGKQGQVVGFDSQGNAQAQDPPGGGSGKRVCRFVVGTSTSGWTADDCDYLCDGTADDVEINAAIQALPSTGGEIVILDGTYNITAAISVNKDGVTLSGNGATTVLKRMWNSTSSEGIITITAANGGCCVKSLCIDGSDYAGNGNYGIFTAESCKDCICNAIMFKNNYMALKTKGNAISVIGNIFINNNNGIQLEGDSNVIANNACSESTNAAISCVCDNSLIVGNRCENSLSGINITSGSNNTVVGNTCNNNGIGINVSVNANNNNITGNTCIRGNGTSSDYTDSQYTIKLTSFSTNNLIVSNLIMGKNYVDEGTNNTFANNKHQ